MLFFGCCNFLFFCFFFLPLVILPLPFFNIMLFSFYFLLIFFICPLLLSSLISRLLPIVKPAVTVCRMRLCVCVCLRIRCRLCILRFFYINVLVRQCMIHLRVYASIFCNLLVYVMVYVFFCISPYVFLQLLFIFWFSLCLFVE